MQMTESTDDKGNEAIRHRAYMIWLAEGQPDGRADDHWHQAVAEIQEESERIGAPSSPPDHAVNKARR
jgi:Protein of unknown function (DUF2934)